VTHLGSRLSCIRADPREVKLNRNRYNASTPRIALGLTAIAMSAISMITMVVLPATLDVASAGSVMAGGVHVRDPGAVKVARSRITAIRPNERTRP
jgi:hypothetical protein